MEPDIVFKTETEAVRYQQYVENFYRERYDRIINDLQKNIDLLKRNAEASASQYNALVSQKENIELAHEHLKLFYDEEREKNAALEARIKQLETEAENIFSFSSTPTTGSKKRCIELE